MLILPPWLRGGSVVSSPPAVFDYYISTTGSDSNDGSQGSPWAITAINTKAGTIAGKSVGLLDGTYNIFSLGGDPDYNEPALHPPSGSAGNQTVIAAVNSRQAHLVMNSGGSRFENPGIGGNGRTGYITIRGLKISGGKFRGIQFYHGTQHTTTNCVIEDCEVYDVDERSFGVSGANVSGIRLEGCIDCTVSNCKVYTVYEGNSTHNGACIEFFTSRNCVAEYCTLYDAICGIYVKQSNNRDHTARFNYMEDISESLLGWDFGGSTTTHSIHHNVMTGSNLAFTGDFVQLIPSNLQFYNNTITSDANGFEVGGVIALTATGKLSFYNNIITQSAAPGYRGAFSMNSDGPGICDYNCYPASNFSNGLNSSGDTGAPTTYSSLANWRTASSKDANSLATNPLFTGSGSGPLAYQLQGGSPCKNTGKSDGTSGGSNVDMGAWGNGATSIGCDF